MTIRSSSRAVRHASVRLAKPAEARSVSDEGDFGPFTYHSVMMYRPHHPDIARWNGASICSSVDAIGFVRSRIGA